MSLWLEITARKNLGTNQKPVVGVQLANEDDLVFTPPDGMSVRDQTGRWFRARVKPEHGEWIELVPEDGGRGPSKDRLEIP